MADVFKKVCIIEAIHQKHLPPFALFFSTKSVLPLKKEIYVIYRAGGPYGKKLCPRS